MLHVELAEQASIEAVNGDLAASTDGCDTDDALSAKDAKRTLQSHIETAYTHRFTISLTDAGDLVGREQQLALGRAVVRVIEGYSRNDAVGKRIETGEAIRSNDPVGIRLEGELVDGGSGTSRE